MAGADAGEDDQWLYGDGEFDDLAGGKSARVVVYSTIEMMHI